jgi:hypothetical protein
LALKFGVVFSEETDAPLPVIASSLARRRYDFVDDCHASALLEVILAMLSQRSLVDELPRTRRRER